MLLPCAGTGAQKGANEQIRYYRTNLAKDPKHWPSYAGLGVAYLLKARETDDFSYYAKAEKALKRSQELQPNYDALRYLGAVCVAQHRFKEGIKYGLQTVETWPSDTQSYVFLDDAYLGIGDYESAAQVVQKMLAIKADFYALNHSARLRHIRGDVDEAIQEMQRALTMASQDEMSQALAPWCSVQLGSYYFGRGDLEKAEGSYQKALTASPNYTLGVEHLAELRTAQKKYPEAIELYQRLLKRRGNAAWQAALADLYAQSGHAGEARRLLRETETAYRRAIAAGRVDYYRHLARLYLDHDQRLPEALSLAQKDLDVRHDVYAYDMLAWAYYKTERYQDAAKSIQEALRWGTKDAELFFHAGMIYYRSSDIPKAKDYLQRALTTNPYFNQAQAETARTILKQSTSS